MAEIKKKIIVEDWTFVVRVKVNPGCKRDVNIEVRHASTAPLSLHEEVKSAHSSKISVRVAAKPTVDSFGPTPEQRPKRKYDSCWEQEGETQSDGDEELEFLYRRQKVAKTAASSQQHVHEKSSISELPTEILMQILHFLPPLDIIQSVQAVSHAWQSISCDESFWHLVYGRHVGNPDFRPKHGWKTACRSALDALHLHQHMCREAQARKRELFQWRHFSWLCKKGHSKLVEQMLRPRDVFLNVNTQDKESECTALMVAAMKGHGDIVAMLCAQSAALDLTDRHGITALMYAAREGHLAPLQTLLAAGADCNAKTNNGSTCLMIAAKEGYHQIVSCLLRHGASDECNQNGSTALTFAAEKARSEAVEVLLQHNANVNAKTNKRGITPLIFSVKARDLVTARMLLEHGANVNAQTSRTKYTALIAAVRNKDEDMIKLLLEFNADPCLTCHMGRNAFDYAEEEGIDYLRIPSTTPVQAI